MLKIKTIVKKIYEAEQFDAEVNEAIEHGWKLTKREVLLPHAHSRDTHTTTKLYAELVMEIITEKERCCENCAHCCKGPKEDPCRRCSEDADMWEPAE